MIEIVCICYLTVLEESKLCANIRAIDAIMNKTFMISFAKKAI
jgi:hypothetical protein